MHLLELVVIVVAAVVAVSGAVVGAVVARRHRTLELEAPPEAPSAPPTPPPEAPPVPGVPEAPPEAPSAPTPPPVPEPPQAPPVPEPPSALPVPEAPPIPEAPPRPEVPPAPPAPLEAPPVPAQEALVGEAAVLERPRFRDRLGRARGLLAGYVGSVLSRDTIDEETWDELEEALIRADVGVATTTRLLEGLRAQVSQEGIRRPDALVEALKAGLKKALAQGDRSLHLEPGGPNVWLFVGVNGVGKTTTVGKVGMREARAGRHVVMAAGDTFRAAAVEQLGLWAARVEADLVRGAEGGDPGSVVFDAVVRAASRQADLVLADTAGRLHTKTNLMEELRKVRRIAERPPGQLSEVLLVIDATTGQNGLIQARQFTDAVGCTGVVLTKLDGTAKGGIALAIQVELGLPIKLVGLGEGAEDLVDFDPDEFVDAIFT